MDIYKNKYYKYKNKYLFLKYKQFGGSYNIIDINNTKQFTKRKDIFNPDEKEECLKSVKYGYEYKTNKKYDKFVQLYYHAGNYEDIYKFAFQPIKKLFFNNNVNKNLKISLTGNVYNKYKITIPKIYKTINFKVIKYTLDYNFNKFKKGLLVVIKDQKLQVYLPFSNVDYKNEFSEYLVLEGENNNMLKHIEDLKNKKNLSTKEEELYDNLISKSRENLLNFARKYKKRYVYDRNKWVSNNCIFRNTFPEYEGDKLTSEYKYLLVKLLENRKIPDVIFFLNLRDFPILKKDLTEPYEHIYNSENKKMDKKYIHDFYTPILSRCTTNLHADIPIPTEDDITRISNKIFPDKCKTNYTHESIKDVETSWNNKIHKAIYMGQATGCGITIDTNMRLKAADLSIKHPEYLKAGITGWNTRLKKYKNNPLQIINPKDFKFTLSEKISKKKISRYKYQLEIDGHVSPFRLSFDMSYNSLLLIVESKNYMWFSKLLKPYEHYIPIKKDLSDLIQKIKWCQENDSKCEKIAENAKYFFNKYLSKEGIYDYMQKVLVELSYKK